MTRQLGCDSAQQRTAQRRSTLSPMKILVLGLLLARAYAAIVRGRARRISRHGRLGGENLVSNVAHAVSIPTIATFNINNNRENVTVAYLRLYQRSEGFWRVKQTKGETAGQALFRELRKRCSLTNSFEHVAPRIVL
jgi:hypothetical protein